MKRIAPTVGQNVIEEENRPPQRGHGFSQDRATGASRQSDLG